MSTRRCDYHLVDVFTDRAFGGNPLAVFPEGRGLSSATMQAIAQEMNLSETTFVLPPEDARCDFHVRIFTPGAELPMAGHPTIGTTFILARAGLVRPMTERITLQEGVGPVPVTMRWKDGAPEFMEMEQPLPHFSAPVNDPASIAQVLSLDEDAIRSTGWPVQTVSCGVPFLIVPLRDLAAMRRLRFRRELCEELPAEFGAREILVFTTETETAQAQVHCRMFAPSFGLGEDAATGGAHGPLGSYLARHGVLPSDGELNFISEQGIEMGRPSFLHVRIAHTRGEITAARVGGSCHYMGAGHLELGDEALA